jgi:hypothetical protein
LIQLYKTLDWEDEGIREHTAELLAKIAEVVPEAEKEDEDAVEVDEAEWESDSGDEEMQD